MKNDRDGGVRASALQLQRQTTGAQVGPGADLSNYSDND